MAVFKRKRAGKDGKAEVDGVWTVQLTDHSGVRRRIPGFVSRAASMELERNIRKLVSTRQAGGSPDAESNRFLEAAPAVVRDKLALWGVIERQRAIGGRALSVLAEEWEKHLRARQCAESHCRESLSSIRKFIKETGVVLWSEVTSSGVENWLAGLRSSRASNRTSNAYLAKLKAFSNWMVNVRYASGNPLSGLRKLNEAADRRLERRALEEDEIGRLLWAAKQGSVVNGLAGHERALLYRLAIKSGLRWNEYRTLLKGDFDFDRCTVAIRAANAKNGRDAEQSLCAELTAALKGYMALFLPSPRRFPECGKVGAVG